jgi:hypothetical protein
MGAEIGRLHDAIGVMPGLVPIGAKLRDLHNAFSVMPGLVPGIHVAAGLASCRTPTLSAGPPDVIVLDLY